MAAVARARNSRSVWVAALFAAALASCAAGQKPDPTKDTKATNAERAYLKGQEERDSKNYMEANRLFEWVRNNFPYSQFAALSELAMADISYERGEYTEAASAYDEFVRAHPSHKNADFASYRVGLAHYQDKASDFFLWPPSSERDQGPLRQALDSLQKFVRRFPRSQYARDARGIIADCRERLRKHEEYAAAFNQKHEAYRGAAQRHLGIADEFGDLESGRVRDRALWAAAQDFRSAQDGADEARTLRRYLQESSLPDHASEARARIVELERTGKTKDRGPYQVSPLPGLPHPPQDTMMPEPTSSEPRPSPVPSQPGEGKTGVPPQP